MLFDVDADQATMLARVMAGAATAGGREALSGPSARAIATADALLWHGLGTDDPQALVAATPAEAAAALGGHDLLARHAVEAAVVVSLVDGSIEQVRSEWIRQLAAALGVDDDGLDALAAAADSNLTVARADTLRANVTAVMQGHDDIFEGDHLFPYRHAPDPDLEARYESLGALGDDTFGKAFWSFYKSNGFAFAGNPAGLVELFATHHDATHVLSGYTTTPQGELLVSTFTAGMHPSEVLAGEFLPIIMSWHLGIELVDLAGRITGQLDPPKFWNAWQRGDATSVDVFDPDWSVFEVAEVPLAELRDRYAIPPLDEQYAASGEAPDWYLPTP